MHISGAGKKMKHYKNYNECQTTSKTYYHTQKKLFFFNFIFEKYVSTYIMIYALCRQNITQVWYTLTYYTSKGSRKKSSFLSDPATKGGGGAGG